MSGTPPAGGRLAGTFLGRLIFALPLLSFLLCLGGAPLFDVDEGAFSEATREMFERGDFLFTYLNGAPRFDKPIFIYWLQALGYLVRNWEEKGRQLGEQASSWPMIYTVSAGPLRPLGYKEGIVTLMEFTWTHGSVIESGEFRHGPLEVVEPGVPFLFLLGNDESRHTTERAIRFVKERTDNVIVIDYADIAQGLHPWLAPFLMFVPMEWLCYYLSIYKDHNPDDRRYYGGLVEY